MSCRTITLGDDCPALYGRLFPVPVLTWPAKDALSNTARSADFSRLLGTRQIASVTYAADLVEIVSAVVVGAVVTLLFAQGTPGTTARVELRAICSDGTDEPAVIMLPVVSQLILTGGDTVSATQTVTTNGTTGGVLGPLPIYAAAGASINIRGSAVARNVATGDTISWDVAVAVKQFGLSGAAIGQQSITPFQDDAAMAACTLAVTVNAGWVMFPITGVAGAAITWSYNLTWAAA
jgi:hypothetical protein